MTILNNDALCNGIKIIVTAVFAFFTMLMIAFGVATWGHLLELRNSDICLKN